MSQDDELCQIKNLTEFLSQTEASNDLAYSSKQTDNELLESIANADNRKTILVDLMEESLFQIEGTEQDIVKKTEDILQCDVTMADIDAAVTQLLQILKESQRESDKKESMCSEEEVSVINLSDEGRREDFQLSAQLGLRVKAIMKAKELNNIDAKALDEVLRELHELSGDITSLEFKAAELKEKLSEQESNNEQMQITFKLFHEEAANIQTMLHSLYAEHASMKSLIVSNMDQSFKDRANDLLCDINGIDKLLVQLEAETAHIQDQASFI